MNLSFSNLLLKMREQSERDESFWKFGAHSFSFASSNCLVRYNQGVALAREKLAGSIDGVGNIFSEKF